MLSLKTYTHNQRYQYDNVIMALFYVIELLSLLWVEKNMGSCEPIAPSRVLRE